MKIPAYEVVVGQNLPDLGMFVRVDGQLVTNMDTDYTFTLLVRDPLDTVTLFTKTAGFTGQAGTGTPPNGTPNLIVQWAPTSELEALTGGKDHKAMLTVTRTADARRSFYEFILRASPRTGG